MNGEGRDSFLSGAEVFLRNLDGEEASGLQSSSGGVPVELDVDELPLGEGVCFFAVG